MKKVIVIGAGPAGLVAASELLLKSDDYDVTLLEESSYIGGIARTVSHNGNRMDIGAHRFFSKDDEVNKWWNDLMPLQGKPAQDDLQTGRKVTLNPNGPNPETEDNVRLFRRRWSRIYYRCKFFDYPIKLNFNTVWNMGIFTTLKAGFSYLMTLLRKLPETSLENFYINRFGYKLYSMFFEDYTQKVWGRHPSAISADWGAQRVKGLSIVAILKDIVQKLLPIKAKNVETSLVEEFTYPKFGAGHLWEQAAQRILNRGGKIILNAKVVSLRSANQKITEVHYIHNGKETTVNADIVISSMPLKDLIAGMNDVPQNIRDIAAGLPYRDFLIVGLLVKKCNLKNNTDFPTPADIIPDCWIYIQDTGVQLGRLDIFNNWSPYMLKNPQKEVFLGLEYFCNVGDELWNMSDDELRAKGTNELLKIKAITSADDVIDAHVERMKKAYPAYFDTYKDINLLVEYLNTFDNLYCVGRNGQHRYNNMDHSMATSFAAVKHILGQINDKKIIWAVNTEKSYHESKKSA
ncbi:MAG: NAD(P)/FAD-dependent oxidoreductase [Alphaproteobacteria bacterium]|nr:NAD(P)/FAD-dependent oxidoreductase [Alphaproteobacteria bacterium]